LLFWSGLEGYDSHEITKGIRCEQAEIVLINKDSHYYQNLFHQVAAICPKSCRFDIKDVIDSNKVQFIHDTVIKLNLRKSYVED
jgi:NADH dehydrogenase